MDRDGSRAGVAAGAWQGVPVRVLQLAALLLVLLKLGLVAGSGAFMDEAYYWMWGQHPALSYYDHPPLNAWLQGLSGALFGWNRFSLRLMVVLSLLGDFGLLWLFARRLAPVDPAPLFWASLVLFLSTPIFFAVTAVALPDHLLILFGLASLYCFHGFLGDWSVTTNKPWTQLYLGALCLGLAVLAKYNGAFIGLGVGLFILVTPRLRPLLGRWQLWGAVLLALALQAPVLAWNIGSNFASFGFILSGRHGGLDNATDGLLPFLVSIPVFLSPFLLWPMFRWAAGAGRMPGDGPARTVFWVSTLAILGLSLVTMALFHWNLPAYLAVLPFLGLVLRSRWLLALHVLYGTIFLGGTLVNYAVMPITDVGRFRDEATAWVYGWDIPADAITRLRAEHAVAFVATPDYTTAALLGYALRDRDVTSLSPRTDQFDFWFDAAAHAGADALLLADDWRPLPDVVAARFASVTRLESLAVEQAGRPVNRFNIYLARGFKGDG